MPGSDDDRYWSVDIPGLTELEAPRLLRWVEAQSMGWHGNGTAVDPGRWLTLHLDRGSVQMLYDGLMRNTPTPENGVVEEFGAWLTSTTDED